MPIVYCEIQPFVKEQSVYRMDEDGKLFLLGKTPVEYLKKVLPELCYAKEAFTIKLKCNIRPIALEIAKDIEEEEQKTYKANQIKVEVE